MSGLATAPGIRSDETQKESMLLEKTQQLTLRAALDRIIPPDDYPGAWEAGVGDYLARQWEGDLRHTLPLYRAGLDALHAEALAQFGVGFAALDAGKQDAILRNVESGDVRANWPVAPQEFFSLLVSHAAEGYYSDPGNGGNRNAVSWDMVGF